MGKRFENIPHGGVKGGKCTITNVPPVVETSDRIAKEIIGEETSLERGATAHALSVLKSGRRFRITP